MFTNNKLAKAVRLACAFGAASTLAFSGSVLAQEEGEEENVEKIQVTGSRLLSNSNLAAATPVLSVSGEEAGVRGNLRVEDFVNVLPQVFAGQASEVSNGATGTATLNLRGLGANRTLVLIDGKRLPYGSSGTSAANVDLVPTQMLDRVDILTGGASAVYGSDAVGGVANFILRDDIEGLEFGGQFSLNYADNNDGLWEGVLNAAEQPIPGSTTDGEETQIYTMFGATTDDGRGNVTIFASYEDRQEIVQRDRVFSGCSLGQSSGSQSFEGFGCVGSANFRLFGGPGGFAFQEENGNIIPYAGGPSQTFNFGQFNFFQRPSERYHFYAKGDYEITDNIEAYADFSYINNVSDAQIAPSASFGIGSYSINCGNPLIQGNSGTPFTDIFGCSADDIANDVIVDGITASHRNVEGGSRNSRLENSTFRFVGGLKGFIDDIWAWNAFGQISETRDSSSATNDFVVANLQQALLATTDADGNVVCIDQSGGCVPYNIFQRSSAGETAVEQGALDFIQGIGIVNGQTSQKVFGADIQADLGDYNISSPFAEEGIGVLFGVEYRKDELESSPDEISQIQGGGFTGVGGATLAVAGAVEVREFFTEVQVPIITGAEFAEELVFSWQYRFSDYDTDGNGEQNSFDTSAFGYSLAWAPVEDVRLRAQFQRAVRAPNVIDLFTGQNTNLPNLSPVARPDGTQVFDPCATSNPVASLEECARTGVTAAQYGTILDVISGQTQSLTGGNPLLQPETADTTTLGVVYTPSQIEGLSISLDYFDIQVDDAIAAGISAQVTLDTCLATGDPTFCDLITRANSGTLAAGTFGVGFQQTNLNIAQLETSGLDLQVGYNFDIDGLGNINLDYAATYLDALDTTPFPGGDVIECAGFFGNSCGAPNPEFRHRFLATWTTPLDVDVTATWRYFGGTDNDNEGDTLEAEFDTVNYIDLAATYYVNDNLQLRGGVLNLLGETPPIFSGAGPALGNGNTYPTVYDISTNWFVSFKATF